MRLRVYGEGNTDCTRGVCEEMRGAIAVLFRRLVERGVNRNLRVDEVEGDRLPRLHRGGGFRAKVMQAIIDAAADQCDGVAVVIDRDGPSNRDRMIHLNEGRERAIESGSALAQTTVIGLAVEAMEAWLLADTASLSTVFQIDGALQGPEDFDDPKAVFDQLVAKRDLSVAEKYDQVAQSANLTAIEARCRAFRDFAEEVRHRLLPTLVQREGR